MIKLKKRLLIPVVLITVTPLVLVNNYTPDYSLPKGALNLRVTQKTIKSTICIVGWTSIIRPSSYFTNNLKKKQMKSRHLPGVLQDYEEDHFIPLELGGAPSNVLNLWPEKRGEATKKDSLENSLKRQVCQGTLSLIEAQHIISNPINWN